MERPGFRAFKLNQPAKLNDPAHAGCLRAWVINGPFHPFWSWWMLAVVHLRPIEGTPTTKKHYPEAEYEFMIVAFNPERGVPDIDAIERDEDWGDKNIPKFLTPFEVVQQFHGTGDENAAKVCDLAAWAIGHGMLSPDQDYRTRWQRAILETVEHMTDGGHQSIPA